MSERLELVRDFAELRTGIKVVIRPCGWCGADHEAFLLNLRTLDDVEDPRGVSARGTGWEVADKPPCAPLDTPAMLLTRESVVGGFVWRVVDGMQASRSTERKLEHAR